MIFHFNLINIYKFSILVSIRVKYKSYYKISIRVSDAIDLENICLCRVGSLNTDIGLK